MATSKCIRYPAKEPLVIIRQSYLSLCDGDHCAAAILGIFEYWHNVKLDQLEQEKAKKRANSRYQEEKNLWVYKSVNELSQDMLGLYGVSKITKALEFLQFRSLIDSRPNDGQGLNRTQQYLFLQPLVQAAVDSLFLTNGNVEKNDSDSLVSTTPYKETETTTETTLGDIPLSPQIESSELNLEDPIAVFTENAYRRTGCGRLKLTRKQDQQTRDKLESEESKMGAVGFRAAMLRFLERSDDEIRREKWPLPWFLKNPTAYASDAARYLFPPAVDLPPIVLEPAVRLDYPARWNELVPAKPVRWDPARSQIAALQDCEKDSVFGERFDEICRMAQAIHTARGAEVGWMTFQYAIKRGSDGVYGWVKILDDYSWMARPAEKSKPRQTQAEKNGAMAQRVIDRLLEEANAEV